MYDQVSHDALSVVVFCTTVHNQVLEYEKTEKKSRTFSGNELSVNLSDLAQFWFIIMANNETHLS